MYHSPNIVKVIISRRLRWTDHEARMEEVEISFKILTGKPTRKRSLRRPWRRWEGNIRMDLIENKVSIRGIGLIWPGVRIIEESL